MNILATLGVNGIIKILQGLGILKDPEQEQKARQALIDAQAKFLDSTSSPIYAIARIVVLFASMWDIFANSGRSWAQAAANLSAQGMIGVVEILPMAWLFVGPEALGLLREMLASARERREGAALPRPPSLPAAGNAGNRVDEPEQTERDDR